MKRTILILYVIYIGLFIAGCAYKGTVYLNSPTGDENQITETLEADAKASLK